VSNLSAMNIFSVETFIHYTYHLYMTTLCCYVFVVPKVEIRSVALNNFPVPFGLAIGKFWDINALTAVHRMMTSLSWAYEVAVSPASLAGPSCEFPWK